MNLKELNFLNPKTRRKVAAGALSVAMGFSIVAPTISAVANVAGIQVSTVKAFADEVTQQGIKKIEQGYFLTTTGKLKGGNTIIATDVKNFAASDFYCLFIIKNDGTVWGKTTVNNGTGYNPYGALGVGDTEDRHDFVQIPIDNVKEIFTTYSSTYFLKNDGTVYACGKNDYGQLGLGDSASSKVLVPTKVNISDVNNIILNESGAFFVKTDKTIWACGQNNIPYGCSGVLGLGTIASINTPTKISIENVKKILTCGFGAVFLTDDGKVYGAGRNFLGAFGTGKTDDVDQLIQLNIADVKDIFAGSEGEYFSQLFFIKNDGSIWGCGDNGGRYAGFNGQLGLGDTTNRLIPTQISISDVKKIISNGNSTYFIKNDGTIWDCGYNNNGQLGLGDTNERLSPTKVNITDIKDVVNGYFWGDNGCVWKTDKTSGLIPITSQILYDTSYTIDKIYNMADENKYGSWLKGFYSKSLYDDNQLMQFILNSSGGTGTLSSGGVFDSSQVRDKYFLSDGSMILVDNYGMVQYYKDLTTASPSTLPIDGSGIIGADLVTFGSGTSAVQHPVLYFSDHSQYIDSDGSLKTFSLNKSDIKDMFTYKYANGISQVMLVEKSDGSLVYFDKDGNQQDFGLNMNDVSYIMPASNVNKDIFVMKDGTLRDDKGAIALPDGLTLKKVWSNRFFEMSDGMLYTFQNGTFKNTNTLAVFAKLALNNALLLKNGNFQTADTSGTLTNDMNVSGNNVTYMSQLDSTNMYLILNDGTTYGIGTNVQGDKLEDHGINIGDVSSFISNGTTGTARALVTKDGTVYTNPGSWTKNTLVHFSNDALDESHKSNPVYTSDEDVLSDYNNSGDPNLINKTPGGSEGNTQIREDIAPQDTTAPSLNITGNPTEWTNTDVTLSISASDEEGGSGLNKIVLPDNSEITAAIGTFKVIKNGTYTFKAYNKAGNITTRDITVSKIDKTAPGVPAVTNNNGTVTITAGTDADSGVKEVDYSVDGGAYQKYTIPFTLEAGSHTVKAKTVDNAGNESSETSKDITVGDSDAGLQNATQAVENAESTKSQGDVDTARDLVDVLPDSQEKQDLEDRLDKVQDEIDKAKEDAQKLHDATDAVDHAGDTKSQEDLDHAKDLVDSLPDGPDKDKLEDDIKDIQDEIDQINQEAQNLADATAAVEKAERTKTKSDYDTAVGKVSALKDGADKTGLSERLDNVKAAVDTLIADADSKVTQAESSKTESDINAAQSAVDKVPAGWDVSGLQDRLDSIRQEVEGQEFAVAKAAVEKAEISQLQEDVNGARVLVNKLPYSQDRTDLNRRLDAVQNIINLYKNAEQRVQAAEKLKTESAVSSARSVVSKLPDGDRKDSLNARLDVVEAEIVIDNTIKAIDRDITALEKDVDSHIKYNSNMDIDSYKNKVTALKNRVNALPDSVSGTKLAFNERLDTVDSKLTKQKGVQDAVSKVVDAIDKAGQTLDNKDIQDAQDAIDNLPDGVDRSKYQSELDIIKQKRQAKVAKDTTDANKAVTKASRTRLQTDVDSARALVNALPDGNNKTQLSKQLDLIQKYVRK